MDTLTEFAISFRTDKWGKHHYTPHYFEMFNDSRKQVKKVLEIGAGEGNGLRMWKEFFSNAMIYGAEIEDWRIFNEDRIEVVLCDQANLKDLENLVKKTGKDLDLVVDDGSHDPQHQVFTCLTLMPMLKRGVVYVIEDVSKPGIVSELSQYNARLVECGDRYDDKLIVVKHKK